MKRILMTGVVALALHAAHVQEPKPPVRLAIMMEKPLAVNMVVTEISDAARESARTGRRIDFRANH